MIRRILYARVTSCVLKNVLSLFYDKKYLRGKFFDEYRMGFIWSIRSIPRSFFQRRLGVRWPIGRNTTVLGGGKITFDPSSINVFQQSGCYFQAFQEIYIGKDCWIGQNTGIITANHDYFNPDLHQVGKKVVVGDKTWIGMNCLILPGVCLGPNTIVGGGSVVTKSFPQGHCIIAGNPAKLIKYLDG